MIFLPDNTSNISSCKPVLHAPWANGTFYTNCDYNPPKPWTVNSSYILYTMAMLIKHPHTTHIAPHNFVFTPNEIRASNAMFNAFLDMQIIVVPQVCDVPADVINDWSISPYTLARSVLQHRPPNFHSSTHQYYYFYGLCAPIVLLLYMALQRKCATRA